MKNNNFEIKKTNTKAIQSTNINSSIAENNNLFIMPTNNINTFGNISNITKQKTNYIPLDKEMMLVPIKSCDKVLRHNPAATLEWNNNNYSYLKGELQVSPIVDQNTLKLINMFFNSTPKNKGTKNSIFRHKSILKTYISAPRSKTSINRARITIYKYDRKKLYYINTLNKTEKSRNVFSSSDLGKKGVRKMYSSTIMLTNNKPNEQNNKILLLTGINPRIRKVLCGYKNMSITIATVNNSSIPAVNKLSRIPYVNSQKPIPKGKKSYSTSALLLNNNGKKKATAYESKVQEEGRSNGLVIDMSTMPVIDILTDIYRRSYDAKYAKNDTLFIEINKQLGELLSDPEVQIIRDNAFLDIWYKYHQNHPEIISQDELFETMDTSRNDEEEAYHVATYSLSVRIANSYYSKHPQEELDSYDMEPFIIIADTNYASDSAYQYSRRVYEYTREFYRTEGDEEHALLMRDRAYDAADIANTQASIANEAAITAENQGLQFAPMLRYASNQASIAALGANEAVNWANRADEQWAFEREAVNKLGHSTWVPTPVLRELALSDPGLKKKKRRGEGYSNCNPDNTSINKRNRRDDEEDGNGYNGIIGQQLANHEFYSVYFTPNREISTVLPFKDNNTLKAGNSFNKEVKYQVSASNYKNINNYLGSAIPIILVILSLFNDLSYESITLFFESISELTASDFISILNNLKDLALKQFKKGWDLATKHCNKWRGSISHHSKPHQHGTKGHAKPWQKKKPLSQAKLRAFLGDADNTIKKIKKNKSFDFSNSSAPKSGPFGGESQVSDQINSKPFYKETDYSSNTSDSGYSSGSYKD
jgi:hypothetical protein